MSLSFLPEYISSATEWLNYNNLSEIRLRVGQPVIVEYNGKYSFLSAVGITEHKNMALICCDVSQILNAATGGCIYKYNEQIKCGFITVAHGVRIGIAGEYVTQGGGVNTITNISSLNIRIPHRIFGCADEILKTLYSERIVSSLIFSPPGLGKTTYLREIAANIGDLHNCSVLVFDERGEIGGQDANGKGFDLGARVDIIKSFNKLSAISSAIRAMKPQVVITDELYGEDDVKAIKYCVDCGIAVIASSHIVDRELHKKMPFEYYIQLTAIGEKAIIYDKNFNVVGGCGTNCNDRGISFRRQEKENVDI
jgi:stage III sporulation protein AA